jgi:hypothetical protein
VKKSYLTNSCTYAHSVGTYILKIRQGGCELHCPGSLKVATLNVGQVSKKRSVLICVLL